MLLPRIQLFFQWTTIKTLQLFQHATLGTWRQDILQSKDFPNSCTKAGRLRSENTRRKEVRIGLHDRVHDAAVNSRSPSYRSIWARPDATRNEVPDREPRRRLRESFPFLPTAEAAPAQGGTAILTAEVGTT